ncbi:TPA: hypothetical protein DIV55_01375 [Patescibacteria group bacterium]|uniref:SUF system FeS cluster assembly SufBD core domain-containing protein n=1 Tax=Candidatus Gottesmanbacteria bacterium GW2011_GWA1_43_11 TaxID=1618436 RepID=A0A0G1EMF6_9BACT|nr:MAG: hypothetical protein UV59_C0024G0012 [Candidatus Gottesmanbacteria bacterium GW2011_GWA1_43_11]HCS78374.1 hypothetical protein [Patescibacteria group bacterium]
MKTANEKQRIIVRKLTSHSKAETFTVKQDEKLTLVLIAVSGIAYSLTVELVGKKAEARILGILIGRKQAEITLHTKQIHTAAETMSDLHIKSVLFDRAILAYAGSIRIEKAAQQSNAYQRNDNLLLSGEAKAESKPALEILANEVRCTHGATLGKIDPEELFYLESRGLNQAKAQKIIIEGYFLSLLEKIPDETVKKQLVKTLGVIL